MKDNNKDEHELRLLGITYNQIETGVYALILEEVEGSRRIPIVIGYPEAQAIECKLQDVTTPRPLTHDLMAVMLKAFNATLSKITIRRLPSGVFAAYLHLVDDRDKTIILDSRSSDAIALAIRVGAPIYTSSEVLDEAGFNAPGSKLQSPARRAAYSAAVNTPAGNVTARRIDYNAMTDDQLQALIDKAVADEDYEKAGLIKKILEDRSK